MLGSLGTLIKALLIIVPVALAFTTLVKPEDGRWLRGRPLGMFLTLFVSGMIMPSVWIVYALLIGLLPAMARDRGEALAMFPLSVLSVPTLTYYLGVGGIYLLPIDKFLCAGLGLVLAMAMLPGPRVRMGRYADLPFLFLLFLHLVQARGMNATSTLRALVDPLLGIALPYFALSRSFRVAEDYRRLLLVYGFCGALLGTVALYESKSGWLIFQTMYNNLGVAVSTTLYMKMRGGMLRAVTSFSDASAFALFLATAMIALFAVRSSFRSGPRWLAALGMVGIGMISANSRNSFLCVALGLIVFDLYRRDYGALAVKAVIGGVAAGVVVMLAQVSHLAESLSGQSADTIATNDYRHQLLTRGLEEFWKHPWAGLDGETITANMSDMRQGEGIVDFVNAYLYYALTAGIAGPVLLLLSLILPPLLLLRRRSRFELGERELLPIAAYAAAITAAYVATCALTGFGGRDGVPLYIAMSVGAALWAQPRATAAAIVPARPRRAAAALEAEAALRPPSALPAFGRFALPSAAIREHGLT